MAHDSRLRISPLSLIQSESTVDDGDIHEELLGGTLEREFRDGGYQSIGFVIEAR